MKGKITTLGTTEADFEARANAALRAAAPWIDVADVKHQLNFTFKLGKGMVTVDGTKPSHRGRLDILVEVKGQRLAVLELKRPGNALTQDDIEQGLSYARVLHPRPPIVIVFNGEDTRTYAAHDGKLLGSVPEEQAFAELIEAAAKIAASDTRDAISTLMGPDSAVWMAAVRLASDQTLEDLTGGWSDRHAPFTRDCHFPRAASRDAQAALRASRRVVVIEGAPLAGKSHVLRELVEGTRQAEDMAVLFVEAAGTAAAGIVEAVARLLSTALGWRITADEARHWLESFGTGKGPMLVIAVDGLGLEHDKICHELETLSAQPVNSRLKFVIEADTSAADRLWLGQSRRKETAFARRGERIAVGLLDDEEFGQACQVLEDAGVTFMTGADKADEYRQPWLLRSMTAHVASLPKLEGITRILPPLPSLDLFGNVRERFVQDPLIEQAATFARAVLDDYRAKDRPADVVLRAITNFMVRKRTMRDHADSAEIDAMEKSGLLGTVLDEANRGVFVGRFPELIASELSRQIAAELDARMTRKKPQADIADWLVATTARLPLGDLIGAQALIDLGMFRDGISIDFLNRLLDTAPSVRTLRPGSRAMAWLDGIGRLDLVTRDDGVTVMKVPGTPGAIELIEDGQSYADLDAWLILSHLAAIPIGTIAPDDDEAIMGLVHPAILALIGTSPIPLRRVSGDIDRTGMHTHEAPNGASLVCRDHGIIEPVTYSLLRFLDQQVENADAWLDQACKERSPALLDRIALALRQLAELNSDGPTASWARHRLDAKIEPALKLAMIAPGSS
ncbi:type I restriction enzyme HsdR N-terminal domain-containing protein [Sphingomonas sp. MG17]|uniref:Type I restriction enzyme HsdR N-terminal domain-containing protein n=1 Tax=Sphingomonas tagetis TaxID=2949092 RepID=A0A9X2HS41_9SPHN|nr:type I restriction enzyme HsdR N-terminal domain-containing protein [Sphingomonas tagetis]MCP3732574.1 type I restriction enzyme HsdR N-terminal domain-containing protein [Sphingomonas tagetis]